MPPAPRICPTPGCPNPTTGGRCPTCNTRAEQQRGTPHHRGYTGPRYRRFRRLVLTRDPLCVLCGAIATDADHHPLDLRTLTLTGADPYNPDNGRGLCHQCHSKETARHQPGGWNNTTDNANR